MVFTSLQRLFGAQTLSNPDTGYQNPGRNTGTTESGVTVTDEKAMRISGVWACTQLIATTVTGLPLQFFQDTESGRQTVRGRHYLREILARRPNQWMRARDFRMAMTVQAALWNNAYAEILRSGERIVGLVPLKPGRTTPYIDENGDLTYHYRYDKGVKVYARSSILHLKGISFDGVVGADRVAFARESIGLAQAAQSFAASQFRDGGRPGGTLELDKFLKPEQRDQMRKLYQGVTEGALNKNNIWLLEGGIKYNALDYTADQMQMIATRNLQLTEIARFFGVPAVLIGAGENNNSAWPASFEQQMLSFLTFTIGPYLEEWETAIADSLIMGYRDAEEGLGVDHDTDPLVQMDSSAKANYWRTLTQAGIASRNEARIKLKMPKSDDQGADRLTVQANMTELGELQGLHHGTQTPGTE